VTDLDPTLRIPSVLVLLIRHLQKHGISLFYFIFVSHDLFAMLLGLDSEGLFRVSGTQKSVDELKDLLDKGLLFHVISSTLIFKLVLGQVTEQHLLEHTPLSVGAVVKLYLRLLPEPLLTFGLYDALLAAQSKNLNVVA